MRAQAGPAKAQALGLHPPHLPSTSPRPQMMGRDFLQRTPESAQPSSGCPAPTARCQPSRRPCKEGKTEMSRLPNPSCMSGRAPSLTHITSFNSHTEVGICALFNREGSERLCNFPRSHSQNQEIHNQHRVAMQCAIRPAQIPAAAGLHTGPEEPARGSWRPHGKMWASSGTARLSVTANRKGPGVAFAASWGAVGVPQTQPFTEQILKLLLRASCAGRDR